MQNLYLKSLLVFSLSAFAGYGFSQSTINHPDNNSNTIKTLVKAEGELVPTLPSTALSQVKQENGITVLSSENGYKTLLIPDMPLRNEIFNNREKRDMLTALPGFISLGTVENGLRVTITNEYINQYLVKYLGVKEVDLSNIK